MNKPAIALKDFPLFVDGITSTAVQAGPDIVDIPEGLYDGLAKLRYIREPSADELAAAGVPPLAEDPANDPGKGDAERAAREAAERAFAESAAMTANGLDRAAWDALSKEERDRLVAEPRKAAGDDKPPEPDTEALGWLKPAEVNAAVAIPDDWKTALNGNEKRSLAAALSDAPIKDGEAAERAISAEMGRRPADPATPPAA